MFWAAAQFDSSVVTVTNDNLRIHASAHTLRLVGGHLEMVQVATTMTFQRWREQFIKIEPGQ